MYNISMLNWILNYIKYFYKILKLGYFKHLYYKIRFILDIFIT